MAFFSKLHQNAGVSRRASAGPLENGQIQFIEKNLAQLRIRVDVELGTRHLVDLALDTFTLRLEALLEGSKPRQVDCDPRPLHLGKDVDERQLYSVEQPHQLVRLELWLEDPPETKRHVRIFACIVASSFDRTLIERNRGAALSTQVRVGRHGVVEKLEGKHVESVRAPTRIEHVAGKHRVEIQPRDVNAQTSQQQGVELCVLGSLPDRWILDEIAQRSHLWRIERGKVANLSRPALTQQSRGDARGISVRFLLLWGRIEGDLVASSYQAA